MASHMLLMFFFKLKKAVPENSLFFQISLVQTQRP